MIPSAEYLIDVFIKSWPAVLALIAFFGVMWKKQGTIFYILKEIKENQKKTEKHMARFYAHKDDCLANRTEVAKEYITHQQHNEIHTHKIN